MTPDEIVSRIRPELAEQGYTLKLQWIDNRPGGTINGFRITNARILFENALSIQIFDRSTVTLNNGFTNDDAISLTKEDGREFLEWLRYEPDTPLVKELWDALPPGDETPAPLRPESAVLSMGKAHLVDYLVQKHPHIFGRYGRMGAAGQDFYEAVLDTFKEQEESSTNVDVLRLIHSLESLAHDLYRDANPILRLAAKCDQPEQQHMKLLAYAKITAAEMLRSMASKIRGHIANPPAAADYPEAIEIPPQELWARSQYSTGRPECSINGCNAPVGNREDMTLCEEHFQMQWEADRKKTGINLGDLVVMRKTPIPLREGQIGEITQITGLDNYAVTFKDKSWLYCNREDFTPLDPSATATQP